MALPSRTPGDRRRGASRASALVLALAAAAAGCGEGASGRVPGEGSRPNLVLIVADDLGYGDLGCYRADGPATPRIDELARQGARLADFHATSPVCAPTRVGLMTGRYQQRAGNLVANDWSSMSPRQAAAYGRELTLALPELLRRGGYVTGLIGKWHLGPAQSDLSPTSRGFDVFRGYVSGSIDYANRINQKGFNDWWHGDVRVQEPGYTTHLITAHAVEFIDAHSDGPFFLVVSHAAPHRPHQLPGEEAFFSLGEKNLWHTAPTTPERYAAIVGELDAGVGEVLDALERNGVADDTLVLFVSDNGAAPGGHNGPFRGGKDELYEGGLRVPAIARWPGVIPAGQVLDGLALTIDVAPTLLAAAGVQAPIFRPLDGISLLPLLTGAAPDPERTAFWEHVTTSGDPQRAVLRGRWLMLQAEGRVQLFDLAEDPGQGRDVSSDHPDLLLELAAAWKRWRRGLDEAPAAR